MGREGLLFQSLESDQGNWIRAHELSCAWAASGIRQ
jgi:hypothetical protein